MTNKPRRIATKSVAKAVKEETKRLSDSTGFVAISATTDLTENPWILPGQETSSQDKLREEFLEDLNDCRFFYKTEPIVSTVLNKMVEISINDLLFSKNDLTDNEFKVFTSLKPMFLTFAEDMALEYLLSGLVVPEISYGKLDKATLLQMGVKKYPSLVAPTSMFIRDPKTIEIDVSLMSDQPSYYVTIPDDVAYFIKNEGMYPTGNVDKELYKQLKQYFPEFVKAVLAGETKMLLENENVLRRKYTSDNQYPIPFVASSLNALKHKRNLRRMDYSLINKIIGAILQISVGDKDFPLTDSEEDQAYVNLLRSQLTRRYTTGTNNVDVERTYQLITNHTVELKWIYPDSAALLDDKKYVDINQEIMFGLGFPEVLITGSSIKTQGDSELVASSPVKTMDVMRRQVVEVIRSVCAEIAIKNKFKTPPAVEFKVLNLRKFNDFITALTKLYEIGGVSRESFAEYLGYDFKEELDKRAEEEKQLQKSGVPVVGPSPFGGKDIQNQGKTLPNGENQDVVEDDVNTTTNKDNNSGDKNE